MHENLKSRPAALTILQSIVADFEALAAMLDRAVETIFQEQIEADAVARLIQAKAAAERGADLARTALLNAEEGSFIEWHAKGRSMRLGREQWQSPKSPAVPAKP